MTTIRLRTRREFLESTLGLVGASLTVPAWLGATAGALRADEPSRPPAPEDTVLVVLELSGGNDVLSTVVPHGLDEYYRARTATAIPAREVLRLDARLGLHPGLAPLRPLHEAGKLAIVQGVGYPNPNRSHFHAMDIFHTCDHRAPQRGRGWMARWVETQKARPSALAGVALGSDAPRALQGERWQGLALSDASATRWKVAEGEAGGRDARGGAQADPELRFLSTLALEADASTETVRKAVEAFQPSAEYSDQLGTDLATVAALIAGRVPTRLCFVRHQGYDTHAGQKATHDALMASLGKNLAAFFADLKKAGQEKRVVLAAFSEFGRRVKENASGGTDHGAAGAMFLLGDRVRGGLVGEHPSLTELDDGDLAWKTDFRSVYATLVEDWLGGSARAVLGGDYPKLRLIA